VKLLFITMNPSCRRQDNRHREEFMVIRFFITMNSSSCLGLPLDVRVRAGRCGRA
jgi:hypothetical protein